MADNTTVTEDFTTLTTVDETCTKTSNNKKDVNKKDDKYTCAELEDSPWELGRVCDDNMYYITNKTKPYKEFIAKGIPVHHLDKCQGESLVCQLLENKEMLSFEFLLNIIDVIHDSANSQILLVFEYCEGGSLTALITRARNYDEILNEIEVLDWLVQILSAVQVLHQQDITHKDICCNNILLKQNCVRVMEPRYLKWLYKKPECTQESSEHHQCQESNSGFFITTEEAANSNSATKACHVTQLGSDVSYTAPEVLEGEAYTDKADIWSVGCVLYELCSRKKLFTGKTGADILKKINSGKFSKGTIKWPNPFSIDMQDIWKRMMEPDPYLRPSALELMNLPFLADHYQDMKENIAKICHIADDEKSVNSQVYQGKADASTVAQLKYNEYLSDSDLSLHDDLELTEEETWDLLNLGKKS